MTDVADHDPVIGTNGATPDAVAHALAGVDIPHALNQARELARRGIPVFVAPPSGDGQEFALPRGWQHTTPDPEIVDRWRPGWMLGMVTGHGLDVIDEDPRNGGSFNALDGARPAPFGLVDTPSAGRHLYVRSLGVRKRTGFRRGLDIIAGTGGEGHGFVYLPPTVRVSKHGPQKGKHVAYTWSVPFLAEEYDAQSHTDPNAVELLRLLADTEKPSRRDADHTPLTRAGALSVIDNALAGVAKWEADQGVGFRDRLMRAAYTLGGLLDTVITEEEARDRLLAACADAWGAPDADDRRWIEQGIADGRRQPLTILPDPPLTTAPLPASPDYVGPVIPRGELIGATPFTPTDFSDQGVADAALERTRRVVRFAVDTGTWLTRCATHWEPTTCDQAEVIIAQLAHHAPVISKDAIPDDDPYTQQLAELRHRMLTASKSSNIARKIRALVGIPGHPSAMRVTELDADPNIFWAGGIAWDLTRSGETPTPADIDPDTAHLHTAACAPEVISTPCWDAYLAAVWPDPEVRAWALRVLSISLTGHPDAAMPILTGSARSGKTSMVGRIMAALGTYGTAVDSRILAAGDKAHPADVAKLKGTRLAFVDESPRTGHLAEERIKQLTGGGPLTAHNKYQHPITWRPTHTLVMTSNDDPSITDPALRARVRMIPCESPEVVVKAALLALLDVWETERAGVLTHLMREAAAWLADRDSATTARAPEVVRVLEADTAAAQDPVSAWVDTCCTSDAEGTLAATLYEAFLVWTRGVERFRFTGRTSQAAFGRQLTALGHAPFKGGPNGDRVFRPLRIVKGDEWLPPLEPTGGAGSPTERKPGVPEASGQFRTVPDSCVSKLSGYVTRENTDFRTVRTLNPETKSTRQNQLVDHGYTHDQPRHTPSTGNKRENYPDCPEASGSAIVSAGQGIQEASGQFLGNCPEASGGSSTGSDATPTLFSPSVTASGVYTELPALVTRGQPTTPQSVTLDDARALLREIARGSVGVDVETSGHSLGHPGYALRTVQLGDAQRAIVLDPGNAEQAAVIRETLRDAKRIIAHSAQADLVPLHRAGLLDMDAVWERVIDTAVLAALNNPTGPLALKPLAADLLGDTAVAPGADAARAALFRTHKWLADVAADTPTARNGWASVPITHPTMIIYAACDVLDTVAVADQMPAIPPELLARERSAQRVTARITREGVALDPDRVQALREEHTQRVEELDAAIRLMGVTNPAAPGQVAARCAALGLQLPATGTGRTSAARTVLEQHRDAEGPAGDLIRLVLQRRHHATILGTFIEPYRTLIEHGDGRVRPTIHTLGARTGRMSSAHPNLQNVPRTGGIRPCFMADTGMTLISADFQAVELRVAAALSGDERLKTMLVDGVDIHGEIAREVYGPAYSKADRYAVKRGVFGHIYGGGVPTLARQVGVSEQVMASAVDVLRDMTPQLARWSETVRQNARRGQTQFRTYSGRVIHLDSASPHKAPNFAIQGTARELLIDALSRWESTPWGACVLLPVHDEIIVMVPASRADQASIALVECMTTELEGVPIAAEPSIPSTHWEDAS